MSNARTGKIARAPFDVRTRANELLRDGAKASAVIKFLESRDIFGVNEQNVTNWRDGGYQDWLKEQSRLDDMRAKREFAMEIVRQNEGSKIHEAGLNMAASQIFELLEDFDAAAMRESLKNDPENYSRIVGALAKISKESLTFQKYRDLVAEQKRKLEAVIKTQFQKGGVTKEAREEFEREVGML
jgi:hypothetical protein